MEETKVNTVFCMKNFARREHVGDLRIDGRIILEWAIRDY
jgi:hypothetical protein